MPPVSAQLTLPKARTTDFTGARFLLTPGRPYKDAVETFSPYERVQAMDPDARHAGVELINTTLASAAARPSVIYVNNRLEGNALGTIMAILEKLGPFLHTFPEKS